MMREYDLIAEWYASVRNPEIGRAEVEAGASLLPPQARVLDVGCGTGVPLSRSLHHDGFVVTGLDSSPEMIARYRKAFPSVPAHCARIQDARFADGSFEAVVAWGVLFHLSPADQALTIERIASWLTPGGWFLFTSGATAGVRTGAMNGVSFDYCSLGSAAYRHLAEQAGMELDAEHTDAWDNHIYRFRKPPPNS